MLKKHNKTKRREGRHMGSEYWTPEELTMIIMDLLGIKKEYDPAMYEGVKRELLKVINIEYKKGTRFPAILGPVRTTVDWIRDGLFESSQVFAQTGGINRTGKDREENERIQKAGAFLKSFGRERSEAIGQGQLRLGLPVNIPYPADTYFTFADDFAELAAEFHMTCLEIFEGKRDVEGRGYALPFHEWKMEPYLNAFKAKLIAKPPTLSDDKMAALLQAYQEWGPWEEWDRLSIDYFKNTDRLFRDVGLVETMIAMDQGLRNPSTSYREVFGNINSLRDNLKKAKPDLTEQQLDTEYQYLRAIIDDWLLNEDNNDPLFKTMSDIFQEALKSGKMEDTHEDRRKLIDAFFLTQMPEAIGTYQNAMWSTILSGDKVQQEHDKKRFADSISKELENALRILGLDMEALEGEKFIKPLIEGIDQQMRTAIQSSEEFEQSGTNDGASAGSVYARAFNEAFAGNMQMDNMVPPDMTGNAGDTSLGAFIRKDFGDFVEGFSLTPLAEDLSNIDEVLAEVNKGLMILDQFDMSAGHLPQFEQMREHLLGAAIALQDIGNGNSAIQSVGDALMGVERQAQELVTRQSANKAMMDLANQAKGAGKELKNADPALRQWAEAYTKNSGKAVSSIDDVIAAIKEEKTTLDTETTAMEGKLAGMLQYWYNVRDGIEPGINGELAADGTPLMDEANNAIAVLTALMKLLGVSKEGEITDPKPKGGGKSKKERAAEEAARAAEEVRRAQEAAWQKELDEQLKHLDRKKRLKEIDTQEEIRQLEHIAAHYAKTTQQKISMEDKLFEARARLRDEEIGQIDKLNQGVITAIRNRYDEQRKIEEKRLQASSDSWREWADENVKAIQDQIDALDALNKQEDRDEQERKKLRKIEATREMIAYTTDDANREQLERELRRLEEDYTKWQRSNAIADEKERLRGEQEAIRERAAQEQEAIAKQRDELAELYDERLKDAALRAEAERILTQSSQEQIPLAA